MCQNSASACGITGYGLACTDCLMGVQIQFDPVVNFKWGMPVRGQRPKPEQVTEAMKDELVEVFDLDTEEKWEVSFI